MFRLFRNLKPMAWVFVAIVLLVTGQSVAELYHPEQMSDIIDDGIYIDYEPLYRYEEMERPSSLAAVESDATLKGYDEDTIPVFEMVDGFTTYDLAEAIEEEEGGDVSIDFVFRDIPVKDSRELFDNVLTPFLEGLEIYQLKAFEWRDANVPQSEWEDWEPDFRESYFTNEDREEISNIINILLVFEYAYDSAGMAVDAENNDLSIKIYSGDVTVNDLLNQDPREDSDAMASESNRRILTACVSRMKHSVYGNLMPIPVDADGNRIATDEYGQALDPEKLVYIYSDRDGNEVARGENGEICVRIDKEKPCGLFAGYYNDDAQTAEVMHDGLYHTRDVAWQDEDGYLWYVGRADDVIKSSGYRIGPFEIESVIMELPYVLECGVSAAPDEIRGQVVKASIVLVKGKEGTEELKKEIQEYVKKHTAPYKYPRIVVFRDELPKTISGKIMRNKL